MASATQRGGTWHIAGTAHAVHRVANLALQLSVRQLRSMNKRTIFTDVKRSVSEAEWFRSTGAGDGPADRLGLRAGDSVEASTVAVGTNPNVLCTRPGFTLGQIVLSQTKLAASMDGSRRHAQVAGATDDSGSEGGVERDEDGDVVP